MRLYNTIQFPRNMTLGAIQDNNLLYEFGKEVGRQCRIIGVDMNMAPVVDVNNNPANPVIADRSFGNDKGLVAEKAACVMRGMLDAGILVCAKHFPGHGDTQCDSHACLPVIPHDKKRMHDIELYPLKKMIELGCPAIMTAHLHVPSYDAEPLTASSLSKGIVTDLLCQELGFTGLVLTDGLGMHAVTDYVDEEHLVLKAFVAGNDILLAPVDVYKAVRQIEEAVLNGQISLEDLDRRVLKILRAKERLGVHMRAPCDTHNLESLLHTDYAHDLVQRLYQSAVTVVRGAEFLPVQQNSFALVQVGGAAHNAFTSAVQARTLGTAVHLQVCPSVQECADAIEQLQSFHTVVVAISGMNKYVNQTFGLAPRTLQLLHDLKAGGKHLIVTLFGSPYSLSYMNEAHSVVVAYEDVSEAHKAAARVVLGECKAVGKLPV